ncbi:hypothetical protein PAMP_018881 [Pampus punctatissimus]
MMEERGQWGSKVEFLLAVAGNVVGLGNVWRFPYLCYKNGGGAFLVPYLVFVVTCGIPLFLLETTIGQYTQEGGITCWRKLCPLAEGIGYGGQLVILYSCMTYIIILSWALLYLVFSFSSQLPWSSCNNYWNTEDCVDFSTRNKTFEWTNQTNTISAAIEFWEHRVLAISGGIEEIGGIRWEVLLCLIALWVVCYFCIWKGVKSTGKVWIEAGTQIFFSFSVGVGSLAVLGSYNTYNNNCYKDCLYLCLLNCVTSVVAGFAVFSVLGFMAHEQDVPISEVAESGPGLAFIAYPQAIAMMPLPQLWSICFFVMFILLGLDTQFVAMEVVMTSFIDMFPTVMRKAGRRERFLLLFCLTCFFFQLVMITEVRADRLNAIIKDMTGVRVNSFFKICWLFLTPLVSLGTFIFSLVEYTPLTYNRWYVYPAWAYVLGWVLALSSIMMVPGWALYKLSSGTGTLRQRFHRQCRPDTDCSMDLKREADLQHIREEELECFSTS